MMHIREQRIEPEREPCVLSRHHQFCEEVGHHLLSDAEKHLHITQAHTATDKVIPDE